MGGADVRLDAERGRCGHLPEVRAVGTTDEEIVAVAECIEEMRRAAHSYRDQAILCSGNDRLARFAEGMERLGIPVLYLGSLFERSEIKDLLALLSILVDHRAMGLVRIAATRQHAISLEEVSCVLAYLKTHDTPALQWAKDIASIEGLTQEGTQCLAQICALLDGFEPFADPWTVLATVLLDRSRMAAEIAMDTDIRARSKGIAIWQFMNFLRNQPAGKGLPIVRVLERIRQLVLHSDERDLRQLPLAAQGIDAVRLMTMHGSKGLEFPVVHIPGLTSAALPRSPNSSLARGVAPVDGLIEGASGSGADASRDAMIEEQECLFFVALSRARDRLFLYHPTTTANGRSRTRSPFIGKLGKTVLLGHVVPSGALPPSEGEAVVPITIDGAFTFSDNQLTLYERCPRRFFYTHILEIGGRRTESAFMKTHVAVQRVVDELPQGPDGLFSMAEAEARFASAWDECGPIDHGYSGEYRRIAWQLIRFYVNSASGMKGLPVPELRLPVSGGEIIITPDQMLSDTAGRIILRRVSTGHKRSKDDDNLAAAAFHIAATSRFPGCRVELVFLSDGEVTPVEMSDRVRENRKTSIVKMGNAVKAGCFPMEESMTCPRCPAYYICGPLPSGRLRKKISA